MFSIVVAVLAAQSVAWTYSAGSEVSTAPAVADVDGDGFGETVFVSRSGVYCLEENGTLKWSYALSETYNAPAVADLENDGTAEVLVTDGALNSATLICLNAVTGALLWSLPLGTAGTWGPPTVANADGIGDAEVFAANDAGKVFCVDANGTPVWTQTEVGWVRGFVVVDVDEDGAAEVLYRAGDGDSARVVCRTAATGALEWRSADIGTAGWSAMPAVADVDDDGFAEIVIGGGGDPDSVFCLERDGTLKWAWEVIVPPDTANLFLSTAAVANVDGAGVAEIAFYAYGVNGVGLLLLCRENPAGTGLNVVWTYPLRDNTGNSALTPTMCDVNGDGIVDVMAVGSAELAVLDGAGGTPLYADSSFSSLTRFEHGATPADVDADGAAEIVAIYGDNGVAMVDGFTGVCRDLFQSHVYHITDVDDNLYVPFVESLYWKPGGHNSFLTQQPQSWLGEDESGAGEPRRVAVTTVVGGLLEAGFDGPTPYALYDAAGALVARGRAERVHIPLAHAGVYFLRAGSRTAKVVNAAR